jgi:hypothetical protein
MFPKFIKIVLAVLTVGYAVYQFAESNIGNGIALVFLASVFVFLYFKNELILLSFLRLRKQDFEGTLRWLQRIKNPSLRAEWLAERLKGQGYAGPRGLQRFQADRGLAVGEKLTVETVLALNEGVPGIPRLTNPTQESP